MTTQLVLDFGDDARAVRAARRPVRPAVPAGAGPRTVSQAGGRRITSRAAAADSRKFATDSRKSAAGERLRPPVRGQAPRPSTDYWRLDERTRAIGARGVEEARRILAGISADRAA
jgi:hypothetical protein